MGEALIDTTYSVIWALDLDQENRFLETRGSSEFSGEEHTSSSGSDLTSTSVDSISVKLNILDVEADTSHVLISQSTFFGGPLEGGLTGILNFIHELALLGNINEQVGTSGLRTETPDLFGIIGVPAKFILKNLVADFNILFGVNLVGFNGV